MVKLNKIYNLDCLEGMNQLKDNSIDMIFVDFPFSSRNKKKYYNWNCDLAKEFFRLLKDTGSLYILNNPHNILLTYPAYSMFHFRNWICLPKRAKKIAPTFNMYAFQHNTILFLTKTKKYIFNWEKPYPSDLWNDYISGGTGNRASIPLEFVEKAIKISTNKKDIVLDCFMGSGTTAIACSKLDRNFLGFEINLDFIKIANNRLKEL